MIPDKNVFLKLGLGVLLDDNPVYFRVIARNNRLQRQIISKEVNNTSRWHDVKVNLSEWSGTKTEFLFEVSGQPGNVAFWSNPVLYALPKERLNVVILLEDALRADHLSSHGHNRDTTPFKDKFFSDGVLFLHAFSQATETRPSCPTIMTSLYPTATGVWNFTEILDDHFLTLAEIMRSQGFATASFVQNPNAGPGAGLHQGFSYLFDRKMIGSRAEHIYSDTLYNWIKSNLDRNLFLYMHLIDPHAPYDPPPPFDAWFNQAVPGKTKLERKWIDPDWVNTVSVEGRRILYDGEVAYNDRCFEGFIQRLKEYVLVADTLIVFISDHGEHLGEHDFWGHHPPGFVQCIHVPLSMIHPKKLPKGVRIRDPVQLIDIMPTILELAGIDSEHLLIAGDSLVSLIHGENSFFWEERVVVSEDVSEKSKIDQSEQGSLFYRNWHLINSKFFSGFPRPAISSWTSPRPWLSKLLPPFASLRVFDYINDKEEEHYLNSFYYDMILKYRIKSIVRDFQNNNGKIWKALSRNLDGSFDYDPEEIEHLRGLGYLQ